MSAQMVAHGTSLADLEARMVALRKSVAADAERCFDELVPMKGAGFFLGGETGLTPMIAWGSDRYPLVGNALGSLCDQLDIPSKFVGVCMERGLHEHGMATLSAFLNQRLSDKPEYTLLARYRRTDAGTVIRAFCSEGYGKFDNHTALDMVIDRMPQGLGKAVALTAYCTEDDLKGTLLFPEVSVDRAGDSAYYLGVHYSNSEVCRGAFQIHPFLFRSFCTNTAIWGKKGLGGHVSVRHYGEVDLETVGKGVTSTLEAIEKGGPNLLNLLGYAREVPVKDPEQAIAYLARMNQMRPHHAQAWRDGLALEPGNNAGAVIDGLTRAAQGYTGDARIHMETVAGDILAPNPAAQVKDIKARWEDYQRGARAFANTKPEKYLRYAGLVPDNSQN